MNRLTREDVFNILRTFAILFLLWAVCPKAKAEDTIAAAEKKYDAAVEAAKKEFVAVLKVEMTKLTKAGDLDGAVKLRDKIAQLDKSALETAKSEEKTKPEKLQFSSVTASIVEANFLAKNCIDGDDATRWSSPRNKDSVNLRFTFAAPMVVNSFILKWESAFAKAYTIQATSDGVNWVDIYSTAEGNGGTEQIEIKKPTVATGIKLLLTKKGTEFGYSLFEVEAYGVKK